MRLDNLHKSLPRATAADGVPDKWAATLCTVTGGFKLPTYQFQIFNLDKYRVVLTILSI